MNEGFLIANDGATCQQVKDGSFHQMLERIKQNA
jgi:hypothetical protein